MPRLDGFKCRVGVFKSSDNLYRSNIPYDSLPASIKLMYSEQEYAWLSDAEKANLIERECMPEE